MALKVNAKKVCRECGLRKYVSRRKGNSAFELRLNSKSCKPIENHLGVFFKLTRDAMFNEKRIFSNQIVEGYNLLFKEETKCKSCVLRYQSEEAMMSDLMTAGNYIKNNLEIEQYKKEK